MARVKSGPIQLTYSCFWLGRSQARIDVLADSADCAQKAAEHHFRDVFPHQHVVKQDIVVMLDENDGEPSA